VLHFDEPTRLGTLKAEDRLLVVADGEDCARCAGDAFARKKVLGDRLHDPPLVRARVLRLVDQNVLHPPVELVEHPLRRVGARQKIARLRYQVGEIECAGAPLGEVIGLQNGVADGEERGGRIVGAGDEEAVCEHLEPRRFRVELFIEAVTVFSKGRAEASRYAAGLPSS
jgi:hypothetical protein